MSCHASRNKHRASLQLEALEDRLVPAIVDVWLSGTTLIAKTDDASTNAQALVSGSYIRILEIVPWAPKNRFWDFDASKVSVVEFRGGAGNDRFENKVSSRAMRAFGGDGNDTLLGNNGADTLWGGKGNDHLNGRAGSDKMYGEAGDDVIIGIDGAYADVADGGADRDVIWLDTSATAKDRVYLPEAIDKVQMVASFTNGADRTLNGDRIADPTARYISGSDAFGTPIWSTGTHKRFANNPLFASTGPALTDIRQGALGDCWMLAGLGAIANDNLHALQQNIVDFDDGTYGVRLGNSFYRVDDDLQVQSSTSTTPVLAALGAQNSMWVAIAEKAYAYYRTGANSYASLQGGFSIEVNRAFGAASSGQKYFNTYSSVTAMANDIYNHWNNYQATTVGFDSVPAGVPLVSGHQYAVAWVTLDTYGAVSSITLYNPWSTDGGGNKDGSDDGFVTVTPAQIFSCAGDVEWGSV